MLDWQEEIRKCFGPEDLIFAETPAEEEAARRLRAKLKQTGISPNLLESAIQDWLHTETSNTSQVYEQMARVRSFFGS